MKARRQATSHSPKVKPPKHKLCKKTSYFCFALERMAETGTVTEDAPVSNLRLYEQLELNKAKKEEGILLPPLLLLRLLLLQQLLPLPSLCL